LERRLIVHLAGPAYSPEEVDGMATIASLLESSGFEVYFQQRDGIGSVLPLSASPGCGEGHRRVLESASFALEIYKLAHCCDCLVFDMNGRVPDDGGAFLAAAAFALGKPVVLYKRDLRTKLYGNDNAMISGLSFDFSPVSEPGKLGGEVRKAIGRFAYPGARVASMPPLVKMNADLGRVVWESLQRLKASGSNVGPDEFYAELASACEASEAWRFRTTAQPAV
jgi:nucleoside 2-deoxyribosyltransferase